MNNLYDNTYIDMYTILIQYKDTIIINLNLITNRGTKLIDI